MVVFSKVLGLVSVFLSMFEKKAQQQAVSPKYSIIPTPDPMPEPTADKKEVSKINWKEVDKIVDDSYQAWVDKRKEEQGTNTTSTKEPETETPLQRLQRLRDEKNSRREKV